MMTLNEQAYEHLKKMISEGELSYHEIYSGQKLSRELGISHLLSAMQSTGWCRKAILILFQARDFAFISLPGRM